MIYLTRKLEEAVQSLLENKDLADTQLTREGVKKSLQSFKGDELATFTFLKKYAVRDLSGKIIEYTIEEAQERWANTLVKLENRKWKKTAWTKEDYLKLYKVFIPGGRQVLALGNKYLNKATLSNCYTTKIEGDNLESIFKAAYELAKTYSYAGGQGVCLSGLRPRGAKVSNTARTSTGSVSFGELLSDITGHIGQLGRRGACLESQIISHPDIEEFIEAKHGSIKRIRYANLSIKITDDFMKAVEEGTPWELYFKTKHEEIRKTVSARALFRKIVTAARDKAEPGVLFWDTIMKMAPDNSYEQLQIVGTNACSELNLPAYGACVLGSIILSNLVTNPFTKEATIDWDLFRFAIQGGVRHLDDIVEINLSRHPLIEQEGVARSGRRIGLGITGLADLYSAMGITYGSTEAKSLINTIMEFKRNEEYKTSIQLAQERGAFPLFDKEKHYSRGFSATLPEDIQQLGKEYGQRNVGISTIAPSGSISILAHCSSGIEPIFFLEGTRVVELGTERKEYPLIHPGLVRYQTINKKEIDKELFPTAYDIHYKDRIETQAIAQKFVDSSISSTINLPNDTTIETVESIYTEAWKAGLKGITVYREGSREGIILGKKDSLPTSPIGSQEMDTVTYKFFAEGGDKFYVHISYQDKDINKPYQLFITNYKAGDNDRFRKLGNDLVRVLEESEEIPSLKLSEQISRSHNTLHKITRLISLGLKYNCLEKCLDVLSLEEHYFVGTLAHRLYSVLSKSSSKRNSGKICKHCGSTNITMREGCVLCKDCLTSGCE